MGLGTKGRCFISNNALNVDNLGSCNNLNNALCIIMSMCIILWDRSGSRFIKALCMKLTGIWHLRVMKHQKYEA